LSTKSTHRFDKKENKAIKFYLGVEVMNMKKWCTFILVMIMIFCFTNLVFAAWPTNMEGKPYTLLQHHSEGYFIWHDISGMHLRVATVNGENHVFTGTIETNGRIENIMVKSLDDRDYSRLIHHDTLVFQLTTAGESFGIDFNLLDSLVIKFELFMDGHKIDPHKIYFGNDGWHPNDATFSIYDSEGSPGTEHIILDWDWWGPWPYPDPGPNPGPGPRHP
jgi:hypothetical protein